jgi:hypothetical protein
MRVSMMEECPGWKVSKRHAARLAIGLVMTLAAQGAWAAGQALARDRADDIHVTARAALNGRFGLEIRPGLRAGQPARDAFVAVGPEKGFSNETALEAGFTIDVGRLSLAQDRASSGVLPFLRMGDPTGPANVLVFLEETPSGSWLVGALTRDDPSGALVLAGQAPLPFQKLQGSGPLPPRLELEWKASSADAPTGCVRVTHVHPDGSRDLLFERTDLNNGSQVVNHVRLGVLAGDRAPGISGQLFLDDFDVNRLLPPLAQEAGVTSGGRRD